MKKRHFCCSCNDFHKGNKVAHSHCDNERSARFHVMLKHNGRIEACCFWNKKKRRSHERK